VRELPEEDIRGDGIRLRPARVEDADDIATACADPAIQRYVPALPSPYTRADALNWITEGRATVRAAGGAALVAADPATDRVLGTIGLHHVWRADGLGEVGYWVAPWARGQGIATSMVASVTGWANKHGIYRVELLTEMDNWPSQRVAIAAGFTREGNRRGAGRGRAGNRQDLVVWARTADDPEGPTRRLLPDLPGGSLTDGVVTLRPLWSQDTNDLYALRTLPESVATSVPPIVPDQVGVARRCAEAPGHWLAGTRAAMTVRDTATDQFAGEIALFYNDPMSGEGMLGYGMMPAWRRKGYMARAVRLVCDWAFKDAGVARLVAGTNPDNTGSQRVLESTGFSREGYLRSRLPGPDGTRIDDIVFALLPGDPR
jgi:RimJ/RimL family protein N-acetyltransferase